jgi:hypothetical protein
MPAPSTDSTAFPLQLPPLPARARPRIVWPAWAAAIGRRFLYLFALKTAGIAAFMALFFVGYFHTLRYPAYPVFEMPLTALDRLIPFQPSFLWAYASLWVYVGIPPGIQASFRSLLAYGAWITGLCGVGLASFYFWPTAVPPSGIPIDLAAHPGFAVLQGVDAAGNACPSLHVATAVFSGLWLARLLRDVGAPAWLHAVNGVWGVLIVYSTVAIRQHVVWDVAAGALLGAVFAVASLHWRPDRDRVR